MDDKRINEMLNELTEMLSQQQSALTIMLAKSIQNTEDRTRAVTLANRIFSVFHKTDNPDQYAADQKELQQIIQKYAPNSPIG